VKILDEWSPQHSNKIFEKWNLKDTKFYKSWNSFETKQKVSKVMLTYLKIFKMPNLHQKAWKI